MPNVSEKKLKLLYLAQMLWEKTDERHAISLPQMLEELESRGVSAERKSLYDDLETLRKFGFSIETRKTKTFEYFLKEHPLTSGELALLADAINQAPFLSQRKAGQLLKKLSVIASQYQAEEMFHPTGERTEDENEERKEETGKPPRLTDEEMLHWAMERDVQVIFQTEGWKMTSGGTLRRVNQTLTVSPWKVIHRQGVAWLMAYDKEHKEMRRFSLAEISQVQLLSQPREGERFLPPQEKLTFECLPEFLPRIARYFGQELTVESSSKGKCKVVVKAPVDADLFAWLFTVGSDVRLAGPKKVCEQFRERAKTLAKAYKS